ncbi:hypothetical protein PCK2_000041 [Pneumocystis canis]|nr:hypothetical protein PCK2_000041 [Pneumocystis canis]
MEEKSEIKPLGLRMLSYFERLWRRPTAHILNSFFGVPFVLPSSEHSAFILMDDVRSCGGEERGKRCKKGSPDMDEEFRRAMNDYFVQPAWLLHSFFDWMIPSWDGYMMPGYFRWGMPERMWFYRNMNEWDRMWDGLMRPGPFFNDEWWKEAFEESKMKNMETVNISEPKNSGNQVDMKDSSQKRVISMFTKKTSRTFKDGSYEMIEIIKQCFNDGTCETTEYRDSSAGQSSKQKELLDNKDSLSSALMHEEKTDVDSTFTKE